MRKLRSLKSWVTDYEAVKKAIDDLNVFFDFYKEGEASEEEMDAEYKAVIKLVDALELKNRITSYNVCYTKLLRFALKHVFKLQCIY